MVEEKKTINIGISFDKLKEKLKEAKKFIRERDNTTRKLEGTNGNTTQKNEPSYKEFISRQKQIKKEQNNIKKELSDQSKLINEAKNGILDPIGAGKNKLLGILGKVAYAAILLEIVNLIIERLKKEFGPGGRWDLRKLVKVAVSEYLPSIKSRIKRLRGEIYFSSGHETNVVYQGAPGISNTERKSDAHLRDILIDPGR